jgi:hypothetical protein
VLGQRRRVGGDRQRHRLLVDEGVGRRLAGELHRHLDGDALALADGDEVDVLEVALERVADDRLGQRQLVAVGRLQGEQLVGVVLERQHELVARQGVVARGVTVAVQDGRHLVGPAHAARSTLAELGAGLSGDADLGHSGTPRTGADGWWTGAVREQQGARVRSGRV